MHNIEEDFKFLFETSKHYTYLRRKKTLIDRDPLTQDLLFGLRNYDGTHEEPPDFLDVKKKIEDKWRVRIGITARTNYLATMRGEEWAKTTSQEPFFCFSFDNETPVMQTHSPFGDNKILIRIDLDLIDQSTNSQKYVKDIVWKIVKKNFAEKQRNPKNHIYRTKNEEKFEQHLKWYDLHMGTNYQNPNGYSFRAIAFLEYVHRNYPELYEDTKERITTRTKVVRSARGERELKGVVGEPIKGEDAVEKGVKLIYKAIHRKPYPSTKTKQKDYSCPKHGLKCSKDCPSFIDFMKDFNRRNMLFKPLYTTDPTHLSHVIGENSQEDTSD